MRYFHHGYEVLDGRSYNSSFEISLGDFAKTVVVVNESVIKNYIKNQHDESMEA